MATRIAVMNKGVLQQLDSPQNLYDKPANLFVAGFIGSPAMNFFQAKIRKDGEKLFVDGKGFSVKIPTKFNEKYAKLAGKDIIFGIRPENIHNPEYVPTGIDAERVKVKVDVTELMGNEILVYFLLGESTMVARVDPRSHYTIGSEVDVVFNMDNIHIFDPSENAENPPAIR
jgi:multiple sugar transport system ATP-binding protein